MKKTTTNVKKNRKAPNLQVELTNENIDVIPVMAWSILPDGSLDFVNQRWIDYAGMSLDNAVKNVKHIIYPDDFSDVMEQWQTNKNAGTSFDKEMRLRSANGDYHWFHVRTAPLRDKNGMIVKWYGVAIEIDDRRQAQEELRLAYQRLSYHVENTPLAVIEWDKDLYVRRWSVQAEKIFGWKASEVLGKTMLDRYFPFVYEEDQEFVDKIADELSRGVVDRKIVLNRNYTKDHNIVHCEWYNSVLRDEGGNVVTVLSFAQDVTERIKAEEKLNQSYEQIRSLSQHLRSIREEERKFVAREIHDELGQYLTVLKMDVGTINKKLHTTDNVVRKKVEGLNHLIDNILESVQRIASELRPSLLDDLGLGAAIAWHLEEFEKQTGIKTAFVEPKQECDLPDAVKTNLFRIFQESLTNVARHSKATKVKVRLIKGDEALILTISDNGIGFNPENEMKKHTLGILGMQERAAIVEGKYEIQSQQGKGTIISVIVPLSKKSDEL